MVKCRDCSFCREDCVNSYFGGGLYWITFCQYNVVQYRLVDADVLRDCGRFNPRKEGEPLCKRDAEIVIN
jgi:hypothetical protein